MRMFICIVLFIFAVPGIYPSYAQNKVIPKGFSFDSPKEYKEYPKFHGGAGAVRFMEGFGPEAFGTKHQFLRTGVIPPHGSIGEYRTIGADELYIIMNGLAYVTVNGRTGCIPGGSMVPCKMNESIGIYNPTEEDISFAWIATCDIKGKYETIDLGRDLSDRKMEEPCPFVWTPVDFGGCRRNLGSAHGGKGNVFGTYGNIRAPYFNFSWQIGGLLAPAGTSIGYHRHTIHEELFFVVSGQARGTVDDVTMDLKPGDCILCPLGSAHGIYNNGKGDLLILVSMLSSLPGGKYLSDDFGDDLSTR